MNEKKQSYFSKKRLSYVSAAVLLIVGGTTLSILNLLGAVKGPWSGILSVVFTALGVVLALFQWLLPFSFELTKSSVDLKPVILEPERNLKLHVSVEGSDLGVTSHTGALIIYARKSMLGESVDLLRNHILPLAHSTANVGRRSVNNQIVCVAIFPYLEPSDYVACDTKGYYKTKITVLPGQVTELEWRKPRMGLTG